MKEKIRNHNIKTNPSSAWLFKPRLIRIGVSRSCNFHCLMCWSYSSILKDPRKDEWKKVKINRDLAMRTIKEASEIGFQRILFSGFGEPFTHSNMIDFVKESAKRNLGVIIQTNLSLVNPSELTKALNGIEENSVICANVGASNPHIYKKIHQNVSQKDFHDILNKMKFLLKNNIKVRMVHIVIRPNYQEIEKVIKLNKRVGSFLHLELADFIKGEGVESITIDRKERRELGKKISYLRGKDRQTNSNISDFLEQIRYRGIGMERIKRCLIGYNFCVINEIGNVHYCFNRGSDRFFMGDLNQSSLREIWSSNKYNIMRKKLESGEFFEECESYCTKSNRVGSSRSSNFKLRFYIDPAISPPLV